jgi:triosephosphate isomerase
LEFSDHFIFLQIVWPKLVAYIIGLRIDTEGIMLIAGNWKMNKNLIESIDFAKELKLALVGIDKIDLLVCPVSIAIAAVSDELRGSNIAVGAQNMHFETSGAFTGEISADMIKSTGATHVILGHSERRHVFGETDEMISKKLKSALDAKLIPILCIGEKIDERESGKTESILEKQINSAFDGLNASSANGLIIAYEPVWAIGTGKTATSQQAEEAHKFVRSLVSKRFGDDFAKNTIILYGGSVKPKNAYELMSCPNVNGALVGGASLKADSFKAIVEESIKAIEN